MVIQPCVCIAASHVGLAGLPVLAVYSSATFCISATLFCFSFTDILSKISCLNFCGAKVQLFFDIRKHLEKNLLISLLFTVIPLCQRSIIQCFKCQDRTLYFHCILYYSLFVFHARMYAAIFCFVSIGEPNPLYPIIRIIYKYNQIPFALIVSIQMESFQKK